MTDLSDCFFWDGQECHYEPLFPGCEQCSDCLPQPFWSFLATASLGLMLANLYLHPQGITNVMNIIDWDYYASRFVD